MEKHILERELSDRIRHVTRAVPFSNATAIRTYEGLNLPGNVGGGCGVICKSLKAALADLPVDARLHRAVGRSASYRKGWPGSHVMVIVETEFGLYAIDPITLQTTPFDLNQNREDIPSYLAGLDNKSTPVFFEKDKDYLKISTPFVSPGLGSVRMYGFFIEPDDAVIVSGLENATTSLPSYALRVVSENGVLQVIYDHSETREVFISECGERQRRMERMSLMNPSALNEVNVVLRPFDLDLETVVPFLKETPLLQGESKWD